MLDQVQLILKTGLTNFDPNFVWCGLFGEVLEKHPTFDLIALYRRSFFQRAKLAIRPFKINCAFWVKIFSKRKERARQKKTHIMKKHTYTNKKKMHHKPKSKFFHWIYCVCVSIWHWKRNEWGDPKRTIYFERPKCSFGLIFLLGICLFVWKVDSNFKCPSS